MSLTKLFKGSSDKNKNKESLEKEIENEIVFNRFVWKDMKWYREGLVEALKPFYPHFSSDSLWKYTGEEYDYLISHGHVSLDILIEDYPKFLIGEKNDNEKGGFLSDYLNFFCSTAKTGGLIERQIDEIYRIYLQRNYGDEGHLQQAYGISHPAISEYYFSLPIMLGVWTECLNKGITKRVLDGRKEDILPFHTKKLANQIRLCYDVLSAYAEYYQKMNEDIKEAFLKNFICPESDFGLVVRPDEADSLPLFVFYASVWKESAGIYFSKEIKQFCSDLDSIIKKHIDEGFGRYYHEHYKRQGFNSYFENNGRPLPMIDDVTEYDGETNYVKKYFIDESDFIKNYKGRTWILYKTQLPIIDITKPNEPLETILRNKEEYHHLASKKHEIKVSELLKYCAK